MIITCPACSTQFAVPQNAIGEEGKQVKCSKCGNIWHQLPLEALADTSNLEPEPTHTEPLPKGGGLPAAIEPHPTPKALKIATLVLCVITLLAAIPAASLHMPALGAAFGMHSTEGLRFVEVTSKRQRLGPRLTFALNGQIVNRAEVTRYVPDMHVTVLSKGGRKLGEAQFAPEKRYLEPGESMGIAPEIGNVSGNAYTLKVSLGTSWHQFFGL